MRRSDLHTLYDFVESLTNLSITDDEM
jgi:hypothetical protein